MADFSDHPSWVEVDLHAIRHNVRVLRDLAGPATQVMAVLKADAYGHGAHLVAPTVLANGATSLALATFSEAARLRAAGITAPILLLGYTPPAQAHAAIALDLAVTLFDAAVARALSAAAVALGRTARAHLKIDTGMSRMGLLPAEALSFAQWAATLPALQLEGVYTHLATADGDWEASGRASDEVVNSRALAEAQLRRFEDLVDRLACAGVRPPMIHAANSATLLRLHQLHGRYNLVRPGLAIYGLHPYTPAPGEPRAPLRPALSWHTRIIRVVDLPAGTPVSYGATYVAPTQRRIATLSVGYADGLRRSPAWPMVLINSMRAPIVGRVCMDYVMCDVSDIAVARVGDRATLIGAQGDDVIRAEEVADWLGTSVYEVLTSIGGRVGRLAVEQHGML